MGYDIDSINEGYMLITTFTFFIYLFMLSYMLYNYSRYIKGLNLCSLILWIPIGLYMIAYKAILVIYNDAPE